jgi:membrane protease YdiL (CAAX protease family)
LKRLQSIPSQSAPSRSLNIAVFLCGCFWIVAAQNASARAAQGIATRLNLPLAEGILEQAFLLFLLLCGFAAIAWIATRNGGLRSNSALAVRSTTRQEWLRGAALGWAALLVAVLPMMLSGSLHPQFWLALPAWGLALLSLATLALYTLALEVAFRGFLFARLIAAVGPVAATTLFSLIYAFASSYRPYSTSLGVAVAFLSGVLLSMAYLRTHALWLGWGLHFAWDASMAILLGLPVAGFGVYNSLVTTSTTGPDWLTGGPYGPEGAALTLLVLCAATVALHRISRDYAWNYTHAPIVPAAYAVVIAPPAAHTAMEAAAAPAPLVQIFSTTSTSSSTLPVIDEHLRSESNRPPAD